MALKITNLENLKRKFERLPRSVKVRAQADIMLAGREINVLQRALVPVDSGALRASIRTEAYTEPFIGAFVRAGGPTTTKSIRRSNKPGVPLYDYALAQEFGTMDMPDATPFFYTAVRAKKSQTKRRIRAGIKKGIKEAASG